MRSLRYVLALTGVALVVFATPYHDALRGRVNRFPATAVASATQVKAVTTAYAAAPGNTGSETHSQYCALWRVDNGFVSTIHLKNTLVVGPLTVTPVLFMADGTEYDLPAVRLVTGGNDDIRVNDALANAPASVAAHLSEYGSAALHYEYPSPGHLQALTEISQAVLSLTYTVQFVGPPDAGTETVEGVWWRHTPEVHGFVALANTTTAPVPVSLRPTGSLGTALAPFAASIPAHATQLFELNSLTQDLPEEETQAGGLRLQYQGKPGAVVAAGGLIGEQLGYSANIPFWPHEPAGDTPAVPVTYASVGLMVGQPDPMMGFPATLRFTPYAVLENTTAAPMTVKTVLNYMSGASPHLSAVSLQRLAPRETRRLDVAAMLKGAGLASLRGYANLSFTFTAHHGELLVATGSVDQSGNWVFPVEPEGAARSFGKSVGYWTTANAMSTMYALWNPTDKAQDFQVTLFYADGLGRYTLPLHLDPQASTIIDVGMLKMQQTPDSSGNVIPDLEEEGAMEISSPKGHAQWLTVVVSAAFYNPHRGTCGCICINCTGFSNPALVADPFAVAVKGTTQLHMHMTYYNGEVDDFTSSASWSSSNTSIATVGNGSTAGLTKGVSAGAMEMFGSVSGVPTVTGEVCEPTNPSCSTSTPEASSDGTSQPTISGPNVVWYFNGLSNSTYPTSVTLQASSNGATSYSWSASDTGQGRVQLSGASSQSVTVAGTALSSKTANDISITVTVGTSSGDATSEPFLMTVEGPSYLSSAGTPVTSCVSGGFQTIVSWQIYDNLDQKMPATVPANESWTTGPTPDYTGENWGQNATANGNAPNGIIPDTISQYDAKAGQWYPTPTCNNPPKGPAVVQWGQEWSVGSNVSGQGLAVQTDTLTKYLDHGDAQ